MAVRNVTRSTANAAEGSLVDELAGVVNQLATLANELKADLNNVLAKLDADAGVSDTDYAALHSVSAANADTIDYRSGPAPA